MADPAPEAAAPRVTLALMAYRQEGLVRAAIEGALAQTYQPLEIILSDDASPDGTFRVMQEMAAAYRGPHTVRLNRNPVNLGIMGHVNRLFELASGGLVVTAAGDDVSEPDRVARLAQVWIDGGGPLDAGGRIAAVHSSLREIDADGRPGGIRRPDPRIIATPDPTPLQIVRWRANCVGASAAWDRAVMDRFGPVEDAREGVEDGPLFFRAALIGEIAYLDAPLLRWRTDGLSGDSGLSPGRDYLSGNRIKYRVWMVATLQSHLRDMARIAEVPDRDVLVRVCRRDLRRFDFEVRLSRASVAGRLAMLPEALLRSLRHRTVFFVVEAFKHLMGPLYVRWHDRHAQSGAAEPGAG